MDEFISKKILYFLKYKYDKDPYDIVDLLKYFDIQAIERNILYLEQQLLVEHHDTMGHNNILARITAGGVEFIEDDLKNNYEINLLEFMRENLEKKQNKLKFDDFPEYLFPDREKLNANLLKYDKSEVAGIHAIGVPRQVRLVFLKSTLINRLEDLKREKENIKSSLDRQPLILNIGGDVVDSQIQQGTIDSTQQGTFTINNQKELAHFIELLKDKLPKLGIAEDDKPLIEADIKTVEAQIESGRPKAGIVKKSFLSIQKILERAVETAIVSEISKFLPGLLDMINKM